MKTLKLFVAFSFVLLLVAGATAQPTNVAFRSGDLAAGFCPILDDASNPLALGDYIGIYMVGTNGVVDDPDPTTHGPGGDDVQPTGNNIDHLEMNAPSPTGTEPPFVPAGCLYSAQTQLTIEPIGIGTEPLVNCGDVVYLRAFNDVDPLTATHYNVMTEVNGVTASTYSLAAPAAPQIVIVCFGDAIGFEPTACVPQESAGPEAASIPMGSTHYFFGETLESHCTLWIEATGGAVNVTEAVLIDAEPPCKPFPATNYMTRYFELWGQPDSFFDVYFGYSQTDYDASDFGTDESQLHVAWYDGSVVACDGEWIKALPTTVNDTPEGGSCMVTTDHLSLWSFGWGDGEQQLPVELTSFVAAAGDRSATLSWTTASETDNDGFYIERSTDGENFVRITNDMIPGAGTSSSNNDYTYADQNLNNGVHYTYRLIDVDINGNEYVNPELVEVTPSFLSDAIVIDEYKLHQNYPNPFNPSTTLVYDVKDQGMVTLKVYNVMGQEVAELVNQSRENGRYAVSFDATGLSSGIYFYTVKVNNFTDTKKMLLVQ
jgi:hypothetical protein